MSRIRTIWTPRESQLTDESVYWHREKHRREFLASVGRSIIAASMAGGLSGLQGCNKPTLEELDAAGKVEVEAGNTHFPAPRAEEFAYGRLETSRQDAAEFCNFYEFTTSKAVYKSIATFQPTPWQVEVTGLCAKPRTFDLDDLYNGFALDERAYRHRCVETWAMCVPWTGFPLADLVKTCEPAATAKFLRIQTFHDSQLTDQMAIGSYPWPYSESLTIAEAMNPLAYVALGIYGQPLPKQHGAPVRLVLPWKYGFKSIKSIVRIEFTDQPPATFWNTLNPHEYDTVANVDPEVPHPRWSQEWERMLGTGETFKTEKYNGYGDYVASLYEG